MRESTGRIRALTGSWTGAEFERPYAPGKWSARQVLIHLAQMELALCSRARLALTTPNYVAQAFDQDRWIALDATMSGREALEAFAAVAAMNRAFFKALSPADRGTTLSHPEYGALTVDWILHQMAGHQIHHLKHFEAIPAR